MNKEMKPSEIREEGKRLYEKELKKTKLKKIKGYADIVIIYVLIGIACGFGVALGTRLGIHII